MLEHVTREGRLQPLGAPLVYGPLPSASLMTILETRRKAAAKEWEPSSAQTCLKVRHRSTMPRRPSRPSSWKTISGIDGSPGDARRPHDVHGLPEETNDEAQTRPDAPGGRILDGV